MFTTLFFHDCYLQTGWIPMQPLQRKIELGDVCQIQQGRMQPLLNLHQAHLIDQQMDSTSLHLNPVDWRIQNGVWQSHCEIRTDTNKAGEAYQWTEQVLSFDQPGSFVFHGNEPRAHLLLNWHHIRDDVTLKLTQMHYNFRDVYVISAVATTHDWGLSIAAQKGARLEMSATLGHTDCFTLLSHNTAQTAKCKGIACYEQARGMPAYFFKAKKLVLCEERVDHYLRHIVENREKLSPAVEANWLTTDLVNLATIHELNQNTCSKFFTWIDCSLDDVVRIVG